MIYLKLSWTVRVLKVNEFDKELALPLPDPYNNEPSHDLPELIMNCESIKREWVREGTSSPSSWSL